MHIENLIKMANQIGSFFEAMPNREEAVADIASHIKRFWEPRMRRELLAHVDATDGGVGLDPIVREAIATHRARLEPAPVAAPAAAPTAAA
ncbi:MULTISPECIES: formate dehydrogenase subunit delta [unclassified Cupriavidus]|uniref:formate dehydrogenase subunit delta n=1 Tax=Cupriavidus sp. H19C3 TaxID=3241603 RepID=UPI003BF8FF85